MGQGWRGRRVNTREWRRVRARILARDGWVCRMVEGCEERATTVDHVVPLSQGGSLLDPSNLRAACAAHNASAGARLPRTPAPDLGSPSRGWTA